MKAIHGGVQEGREGLEDEVGKGRDRLTGYVRDKCARVAEGLHKRVVVSLGPFHNT